MLVFCYNQDLSLVKEVAKYFRIKPKRADVIIDEVVSTVKTWQKIAESLRISISEQERMARAFRVADTYKK